MTIFISQRVGMHQGVRPRARSHALFLRLVLTCWGRAHRPHHHNNSKYTVVGPMLSSLHVIIHLHLRVTQESRNYYNPHFTSENTEAQRG